MAGASAGAMAAGSVLQAYSAIKQGQATQAADEFNAGVARMNAAAALQQGDAAEAQSRLQSNTQIGLERANYGASGVDSTQGSALDVLGSSARQAELEAQQTKYSYQMKALGYETDATLSSFEGKNAAQNGYLSAGGKLLSGAGSIYGLYNKGGGNNTAATGDF